MRERTICPACKRPIKLYNRAGEHVGSEWHHARTVTLTTFITPTIWEEHREWFCNRLQVVDIADQICGTYPGTPTRWRASA